MFYSHVCIIRLQDCPGHAGYNGDDQTWTGWPLTKHTGGNSNTEQLETLAAGTRPRTSHHQSPGPEMASAEEALDDLPWKDEEGQSSIKPTLELLLGQRCERSERRDETYNYGLARAR